MFAGTEKSGPKEPRRLLFKHVVRKIFLEDWALKLTALAITLGLWLGVTVLTKRESGRFSVPLNFRVSDNAILTGSSVQDVTIRVSGDKQKIENLFGNDLRVSLDLSDVEPGERVITLTPQNVLISPLGLKLEDIQPNRVAVNLEAAEQKEIAVRVETEGNPAEGFEIYGKTSAPQKVRVRGPASFIKLLDFLRTDKIEVSGKKEDFVAKQVLVRLPNTDATVSDTVVDVTFRIGERRVERIFLVPVSGVPGKKATVVLYGPKTLLAGVRSENLRVEMVKNDAGEDTPQVDLPDALQGSVEIRSVKVRP